MLKNNMFQSMTDEELIDYEKEEIFKRISNTYKITDAHDRWSGYRQRVTDYLLKYIEHGKTVAILGAGSSNDIDLKRLYEHSGNLTLVDKDIKAMNDAISRYGLIDSPGIKLVEKDFVGISDERYKKIIGICLWHHKEHSSTEEISHEVINELESIFEEINARDIDLGISRHDYVVAIGLFSQLYSMIIHIWDYMQLLFREKDESVAERCALQNDVFIPRFCKALENIASERLFAGAEAWEIDHQCAVQGASQAIEFFKNTTTPEDLDKRRVVIYQDVWPFFDDVTYQMAIINKGLYSIPLLC